MSERTEISFDAALMMALRADAQKELDELPTPAQLKERYPDTSRWDARLKVALHKRRPVLKRVLPVIVHHQKDGLIVEVGEQDKRIFRIGWSELNKRS